jgi:hypothetical protein
MSMVGHIEVDQSDKADPPRPVDRPTVHGKTWEAAIPTCFRETGKRCAPDPCHPTRSPGADANVRADTVFAASTQIEYNLSLISTADSTIKSIEDELLRLKEIGPSRDNSLTAKVNSFAGIQSATELRTEYLLDKMDKAVRTLTKLEKENVQCKAKLATGK